MSKVLVGCPTWSGKAYALEEYIAALKKLETPDGVRYDILLVDNSKTEDYAERIKSLGVAVERIEWHDSAKERIVRSRNLLRKRCLEGGYDHLLSIEQDVIVEPQTIKRLLSHNYKDNNKDYITTLVLAHAVHDEKEVVVPLVSVDFEGRPGRLRYIKGSDMIGELIPIKQAHLACTLLSRKILERFEFRYDNDSFDDTCLCEDLLAAGFTLWCDTVLRPKHKPSGWSGITR